MNAYEMARDNIEDRPFDSDGDRDGAYHYIHRMQVIGILHRIEKKFNIDLKEDLNV